jgi:hypothetical protein
MLELNEREAAIAQLENHYVECEVRLIVTSTFCFITVHNQHSD